jgi:manganese/iron transport system substrate-binding protein
MQITHQPIKCCFAAVAVLTGLIATGCGGPAVEQIQSLNEEAAIEDTEKPNVVSTTTMITDLTAIIGGDEITLTGLLEPGVDPHIYEPVPADIQAVEDADLIFYNGYDLEPELIRIIQASGINARRVAVGEVVEDPLIDMEEDPGSNIPDPHVWGDVSNAMKMAEVIRDELIQLSPDNEPEFIQNADALLAELEELDQWIDSQIQTIPVDQRYLVTTHDAFQYYANAYELTIAGTLIGISTEEQPSAQTVQELVDSIQSLGVSTIFAETTINPRLISTVAEEAGVQLAEAELYSDSVGEPGSDGDSYVKMMVANTRTIVENLGGDYTPFQSTMSMGLLLGRRLLNMS